MARIRCNGVGNRSEARKLKLSGSEKTINEGIYKEGGPLRASAGANRQFSL